MYGLPLMAQNMEKPQVFFTNKNFGTTRGYAMHRTCVVKLKSKPNQTNTLPKAIDKSGLLFSLRLTQQNGLELVFNDSIHLQYNEIEYLVFQDRKNSNKSLLAASMIVALGYGMAYSKGTALIVGLVVGVVPIIFLAQIKRERIYTQDWNLDLQHTPQLYYPNNQHLYYKYWPDLFERY